MTDVEEVRESLQVHGERYLEHVYTDVERRDCGSSARRLAERFAAKEATMKALRCPDRLPWRSIGVICDAGGGPVLALSGAAADRARERGIEQLAVSFTRGAGHAVAVVLASTDARR